jgi:hypothetical protein
MCVAIGILVGLWVGNLPSHAIKAISPFRESSLPSPPPGNRVPVPKFPITRLGSYPAMLSEFSISQ